MADTPPFEAVALEKLSPILGEMMTGDEMGRFLRAARISDESPQSTKWRRLLDNLTRAQAKEKSGAPLVRFIYHAMSPVRFTDDPAVFEASRATINVALALVGLHLREDGKLARVRRARTLTEAEERADRLRVKLRERRCGMTSSLSVGPNSSTVTTSTRFLRRRRASVIASEL
jgi:hypothetical protein